MSTHSSTHFVIYISLCQSLFGVIPTFLLVAFCWSAWWAPASVPP